MELKRRGFFASVARWFDAYAADSADTGEGGAAARRFDWARLLPFIGLHLGCLGVLWVGVSTTAVLVAVMMYALRMFAITAFYHQIGRAHV